MTRRFADPESELKMKRDARDKYADGTHREFYQIGLSPNKTGISIYILGIEDKKYLAEIYASSLGAVTGIASGSKL